ncbi:MAG: hypothetical protein ACRBBS_17595 [Thalassovita sp.]
MTNTFFDACTWEDFSAEDLGKAALVPTMLQFQEQAYYVALARDWAKGAGQIVDLGSFAGGSAACLAEGVRQSGRAQTVHGFDKFEVNDFDVFRKRYDKYLSRSPAVDSTHEAPELVDPIGDDLLPVAAQFLGPWEDRIALYKGQIEKIGWDNGEIEILVMDASKTAESMDKMSALFFPHLIAGQSIVVQQDFLWWQQPWIAVQMSKLAEYFEPVAHVYRDSVSFLCTKKVPDSVIADLRVADMEDAEVIACLRDMKQAVKHLRIDKQMRQLIASVRANPGARKAYKFANKP